MAMFVDAALLENGGFLRELKEGGLQTSCTKQRADTLELMTLKL
jgi:hypothetical protein